jgi:hypothetical protein
MFWRYRRNNWFILMLTFKIKPNLSFSILLYFVLDSRKFHFPESVFCGHRWESKILVVTGSYKRCTSWLKLEICCANLKLFTITLRPLRTLFFIYINSIPLFLNWLVLSKFIFNYVTKKNQRWCGLYSFLFETLPLFFP